MSGWKVAFKKIKDSIDLTDLGGINPRTWARGRKLADAILATEGWKVVGQSYVLDLGFRKEVA